METRRSGRRKNTKRSMGRLTAEELIMNQRKLISKEAEFTKTGAVIAKVLNKAKKR